MTRDTKHLLSRAEYNWTNPKTGKRRAAVCSDAPPRNHLGLTNSFERTTAAIRKGKMKAPWPGCVFLDPDAPGGWTGAPEFQRLLPESGDFRAIVSELCAFVLDRFSRRLAEAGGVPTGAELLLHGRPYAYEDVVRLLDWSANCPAQNIGGYKFDEEPRTLPIFVNYSKDDDAIQYHDRFLSDDSILTLSKSDRRIDSPDALRMTKSVRDGCGDVRALLFVRRDRTDEEAKAFYSLGEMNAEGEPIPVTLTVPDAKRGAMKTVPAFEVRWRLERRVPAELYEYLTTAQ